MSKNFDYIFLELKHAFCKCHRRTQNDENIHGADEHEARGD